MSKELTPAQRLKAEMEAQKLSDLQLTTQQTPYSQTNFLQPGVNSYPGQSSSSTQQYPQNARPSHQQSSSYPTNPQLPLRQATRASQQETTRNQESPSYEEQFGHAGQPTSEEANFSDQLSHQLSHQPRRQEYLTQQTQHNQASRTSSSSSTSRSDQSTPYSQQSVRNSVSKQSGSNQPATLKKLTETERTKLKDNIKDEMKKIVDELSSANKNILVAGGPHAQTRIITEAEKLVERYNAARDNYNIFLDNEGQSKKNIGKMIAEIDDHISSINTRIGVINEKNKRSRAKPFTLLPALVPINNSTKKSEKDSLASDSATGPKKGVEKEFLSIEKESNAIFEIIKSKPSERLIQNANESLTKLKERFEKASLDYGDNLPDKKMAGHWQKIERNFDNITAKIKELQAIGKRKQEIVFDDKSGLDDESVVDHDIMTSFADHGYDNNDYNDSHSNSEKSSDDGSVRSDDQTYSTVQKPDKSKQNSQSLQQQGGIGSVDDRNPRRRPQGHSLLSDQSGFAGDDPDWQPQRQTHQTQLPLMAFLAPQGNVNGGPGQPQGQATVVTPPLPQRNVNGGQGQLPAPSLQVNLLGNQPHQQLHATVVSVPSAPLPRVFLASQPVVNAPGFNGNPAPQQNLTVSPTPSVTPSVGPNFATQNSKKDSTAPALPPRSSSIGTLKPSNSQPLGDNAQPVPKPQGSTMPASQSGQRQKRSVSPTPSASPNFLPPPPPVLPSQMTSVNGSDFDDLPPPPPFLLADEDTLVITPQQVSPQNQGVGAPPPPPPPPPVSPQNQGVPPTVPLVRSRPSSLSSSSSTSSSTVLGLLKDTIPRRHHHASPDKPDAGSLGAMKEEYQEIDLDFAEAHELAALKLRKETLLKSIKELDKNFDDPGKTKPSRPAVAPKPAVTGSKPPVLSSSSSSSSSSSKPSVLSPTPEEIFVTPFGFSCTKNGLKVKLVDADQVHGTGNGTLADVVARGNFKTTGDDPISVGIELINNASSEGRLTLCSIGNSKDLRNEVDVTRAIESLKVGKDVSVVMNVTGKNNQSLQVKGLLVVQTPVHGLDQVSVTSKQQSALLDF